MRRERLFGATKIRRLLVVLTVMALTLLPAQWVGAADGSGASTSGGLTHAQRATLLSIARDTWKFYATDVDPRTHLPLDNIGPNGLRGTYTSAANIGVYLWAVVSARDLGLISEPQARARIRRP